MTFDTLLSQFYKTEPEVAQQAEKTAEERLFQELQGADAVSMANPYESMSDAELAALANELFGNEKTEEQEKLAADMLGGRIMAHACVHELGLIKEALAHGVCRVCKENQLDVAGKSICSACSA